jgi:hypothetical protein
MISSFQDFSKKQDEKTICPQENPIWEVGTGRKLLAGANVVRVR